MTQNILLQAANIYLWLFEVLRCDRAAFLTAFRGQPQAPPFKGGERLTLDL